jgi:putative addiction module component (TIGR02574 family)
MATKQQILEQAKSLPDRERLELAMDLWDLVESDAEEFPLTQAQKDELDRRYAAFLADPTNTVSADEFLDKLEHES